MRCSEYPEEPGSVNLQGEVTNPGDANLPAEVIGPAGEVTPYPTPTPQPHELQ